MYASDDDEQRQSLDRILGSCSETRAVVCSVETWERRVDRSRETTVVGLGLGIDVHGR